MQVRAERGELRITRETFAEHFDGWLKGHHRASKATRDGYRAAGERRLKPFFGPMRLSAIDVQIVRNFAAEMVELVEAGELAPKTVNNTLSCLSTCLKDAVALHKIPSNPCEHIAHLPESHIERDWLRRGEIPLYLAACSELYRPVAELLIATGMRISEALALRWDDIDFDRRVIRVYRQRISRRRRPHQEPPLPLRIRRRQAAADPPRSLRPPVRALRLRPDPPPRVRDAGTRAPPRSRSLAVEHPRRADGPDHRSPATGTSRRWRTRACATCRCTRSGTRPPPPGCWLASR